jgi:hypothetical protein
MVEQLIKLRRELENAAHGQAGKLVDEFSALHGKAKQTVWRWLGAHAGYKPKRKKRSDAGSTKVPEETVLFIGASKNLGVRQNGKATKPTAVAMNIADANGLEVNASASTINRILRQRRMDTQRQAVARNHIHLRAECPNAVHQIDPSLCLIYYMGGKQRVMTEAEFNKNKPVAMERVKLKVWRYTRYDRASAAIDVRYYEAAGENQRSLFDFLLWTWSEQQHRLSHGVPKMLLWDKGSANVSTGIKNLLDAMGVAHEAHATHHAWVKGGVEKSNHIVETHFESRLRDQPVDSVEELNASAALWVRDYNANAIKFVDSRIQRFDGQKHVRDDLWQLILRYPGALIKMPERRVCSYFLTGKDDKRQVRNGLITFVHPEIGKSRTYDLAQWAEFYSQKDWIKVTPLLLQDGAIRAEIEILGKEPLTVQVLPVKDFDAFGDMQSAALIGEERRRAAHTVAEQSATRLAETAYAGANLEEAEENLRKNVRPFQHFNDGKGVVAHTHLGQEALPPRVVPKGRELDIATRETELQRLTPVQMAAWVHGRIGEDWRPEMYAELQRRFPQGATEPELEEVLADLRAGRSAAGRAKLTVIGG